MGTVKSEPADNTASSLSNQPSGGEPAPFSFRRNLLRPFSLVSQLFTHTISQEKKPQFGEKKTKKTIPEINLIAEENEVTWNMEQPFKIVEKNHFKKKEEPLDKGPITLKTYEKHLKKLWEKDPTLSVEEFFKLALKLFSLV